MIDKELIEQYQKIVKPIVASWLFNINYENMGEQDKEEFERDFDEILNLAIKALEQPEIIFCKDCAKHNKDIGDFDDAGEFIWKDRACPLVHYRGKTQGYEFDYQFCSCAERREGRTDE